MLKKYQQFIQLSWFDETELAKQGAIIGQSKGRNTTYFFEKDGKQFVLRKYYRGGLIGKLIKDSYIFTGYKYTRAYQELSLLRKMRKSNLPVPKPVAMKVERGFLTYRASIIIRLIKKSDDLFHVLMKRPLTKSEWQDVGRLIRTFHDQGVYHSDLNIHNILLNDKGKLWLIDFDKSKIIEPNHAVLDNNVQRLLRSLNKEADKHPDFCWKPEDWAWLMQGYHGKTID